MVKIILITHGDMAGSLLKTAAKICSFDVKSIAVFTVSGRTGPVDISKKIERNIDPSGTLVLVDLFGGTSCNVASYLTHGMENVNVLCGLNLNMLLTAINYRDKLSSAELAKKVSQDGVKSILNVTEKLNEHNNDKA
jgi:mannose/fructose-specific phosphotransferase system component IIA